MASVRGFSLAKIAQIRVAFPAFDSRVASARELLRRVSASKLRETNPKCQISSAISSDQSDPPTVEVTFIDGSTMQFDAARRKALDMIAEINEKARTL